MEKIKNKLVVSLKGLKGIQLYCCNSTLPSVQLLTVMERDFEDFSYFGCCKACLSKRLNLSFPCHICFTSVGSCMMVRLVFEFSLENKKRQKKPPPKKCCCSNENILYFVSYVSSWCAFCDRQSLSINNFQP